MVRVTVVKLQVLRALDRVGLRAIAHGSNGVALAC